MSATSVQLVFGVLIADQERWTPEEQIRCEEEAGDDIMYSDWVQARLHRVMLEAGEKFIKEHPSLFKLKEIV